MEPGSLLQSLQCPQPLPIMGHMNTIHNILPYFPIIHLNIIKPYASKSSEYLFHSGFPTQLLYVFIFLGAPDASISSSLIWNDLNNIWRKEGVNELLNIQFSSKFCHFIATLYIIQSC